jgi:WD40 repeat protein
VSAHDPNEEGPRPTDAQDTAVRSRGRPRAFLCVDGADDEHTLAAGTALEGDDALVHIFDTRSPGGALRSHSQTHSEDVATVRFAPGRRLLLSAGTDGLVCTSDPDQDDEDEAGVHVGNWGCSVARAGWIEGAQPGKPAVWAASDMETFSLWSEEVTSQPACASLRSSLIRNLRSARPRSKL